MYLEAKYSKNTCIPVACVPPALYHMGASLTETLLDRAPFGQRHPRDRDPLDRNPLDRDPLLTETPPGQRSPLWTETPSLDRDTPWTETPHGQKHPMVRDTPLDRNTPGQRHPLTETPVNRVTDRCKNINFLQLRCGM